MGLNKPDPIDEEALLALAFFVFVLAVYYASLT